MGSSSEMCLSDVYVTGDNEVSTCAEFDDESWDQTFLEGLTTEQIIETDDSEVETDILPPPPKIETDILPPPPKIQSCREALTLLKDVQAFLESRSAFNEASLTSTLIDQDTVVSAYTNKQTWDHIDHIQGSHRTQGTQ